MKTYSMKSSEIDKKWLLIDAEGLVLGRMASQVAKLLRGKHKPSFTSHMDCGDYVIIINADKVCLTGNKLRDKVYYRHTGYPGGIKSQNAAQILASKHPERVVFKAVERMLCGGVLSRRQLTHLKIYAGPEHAHAAQNPQILDLSVRNRKNQRSQRHV